MVGGLPFWALLAPTSHSSPGQRLKGQATDSDLSVLLAEFVEGLTAAVFFSALGSRRSRLAKGDGDGREECDRSASQFECESCHSSSAMLIKAKGVKAGSRPAFCLVSNPLEGRFSNRSGGACSSNKIADPVNIFAAGSSLDPTRYVHAKRPRFSNGSTHVFGR